MKRYFKFNQNDVVVLLTDIIDPVFHEEYGHFADQGVALMKKADKDNFIKEYLIIDCINDEIPNVEWFKSHYENGNGNLKGIYITGSGFDSFSIEHQWILNLKTLLSEIILDLKFNQIPPIVGVCFGHQILALAAGMRVDRNEKGLEIGMINMDLTKIGQNLFDGNTKLWISEIHNDIVYGQPPEDWSSLAKSDLCDNQAFYKPKTMITFQGHPEFHAGVAKKVYESFYKAGFINDTELYRVIETCNQNPNEGDLMASLMIQLFKNEI
ncbi:hypothetical protein QEN19_001912 [Hanseniaspora menglaensis]